MKVAAKPEHWTKERKTIVWKLFAARSEDLERRLILPVQGYFKDELADILIKLEREGKKIEGHYSGWGQMKLQKALKEDKDVSKINIDRKEEAKRLRRIATPIVKGIMEEYGEERMQDLLERIKLTVQFNVNDPEVLQWIGDRMMRFSKEVTGVSFEAIAKIVRRGFLDGLPLTIIADTLREKFALWDKYRAPLISRTETISAMNRADLFSVEQAGMEKVLRKHWLSSRDAHVRKTHLDADARYAARGIGIKELFIVGTDKMTHPGGGSVAEENINCRCTLYYTEMRKAMGGKNFPIWFKKPHCWERECLHFVGIKQRDNGDPLSLFAVCRAFPFGIPEEISYGNNLHVQPYPGDGGIQFTPRLKKEG